MSITGTEDRIQKLILTEWDFFQETRNIGGRASCQNNYDMFYAMRRSQWSSLWPETVRSCLQDDLEARREGRNPVEEKYGYMMASYAPADYAKIRSALPAVSDRKRELVESIVCVFLLWYEELLPVLPAVLHHGRNLYSHSDSPGSVSIETYLRGELLTYSERTLDLWLASAEQDAAAGTNRVLKIYDETARFYGYASAKEMEKASAS